MTPPSPTQLLICFDGSPGAEQAVDEAGRLFPGAHAAIVHAWRRPRGYGVGYAWIPKDIRADMEQSIEDEAVADAKRGADRAAAAGLVASPSAREADQPVWRELLDAAEQANADVVVAGSRGFGEVGALLLGSTSDALAHHCKRPLLIVPTR